MATVPKTSQRPQQASQAQQTSQARNDYGEAQAGPSEREAQAQGEHGEHRDDELRYDRDPNNHPAKQSEQTAAVDADRFPHAAKANREPSEHEVAEVEAREAFEALPLEGKIKALLDPLIVEVQHQVDHNAPVTASIITQLRVIRALLDDDSERTADAAEDADA
jgi:hypothetical protein